MSPAGYSFAQPPKHFIMLAGLNVADYEPHTVIVKFKNTANDRLAVNNLSGQLQVPAVHLHSVSVTAVQARFPDHGGNAGLTANATSSQADPLSNVYQIRFSGDASVEAVINELLQNKNVIYAEPNYVGRCFDSPNDPFLTSPGQSYLNQIAA